MAEVILSPLLDVIFGKLASGAMEKLGRMWGVDNELENLKSTLSTIQAVLEDAEEMQSESKAIENWLEKLRDVAYDVEDLVDDIAIESGSGGLKRKRQVRDLLRPFSSKREMADRIKKINERLKKISKEKKYFRLPPSPARKQFKTREGSRQLVGSVKDESEIFGRQEEKVRIIESLLSDDSSNSRKFSVIAITGMGGQGKTTLAQLVYNDQAVISKFELRAWVCVSEDFDVIRLTKEIIESASGSSCDLSSIDALQRRLHQILNGKIFLLVLDDVWNENSSYWEILKGPFASGEKGSQIVVTTRNQAVSSVMEAKFTCKLERLSEKDCWTLFRIRAFPYDDEEHVNADYRRLVEIGRELVDKCQGLPLAAKALGGLLSSTRDEREWENVLKSKTWELHGAGGEILPALSLSYQHLPAHQKRCFTFCSVYPKDHRFKQHELVQMWIAHGFVRGKDEEQIEDTGSRYFNDLVQRSFFQSSKYHACYVMHDLVHDLAQSIAGSECFNASDSKHLHGFPKKVRHLWLNRDFIISVNVERIYELRGLRTLFFQENLNWTDEMFNSLKFLRVLELHRCLLPGFIGSLRNLRYLNIANCYTQELPESICNIYNLQMLILNCDALVKLPDGMSELSNLRHLQFGSCFRVESMPPRIGQLTCLQTLSVFIVGREKERGIEELKNLTDLRGSLKVRNLEHVQNAEAAHQADLKSKRFINELDLRWNSRQAGSSTDERLEEEVAEGLQPPPNVKKLYFHGYMGTRFPSWMEKSGMDKLLPDLTHVDLFSCRRCSILPLGQLPSLVDLSICAMDELKHIAEAQCFHLRCLRISKSPQLTSLPRFPSLEQLYLERLDNVEDWCGVGEDEFRNLRVLEVRDCPKLTKWPTNLSALSKLEVEFSGFNSVPLIPSLGSLSIGRSNENLLNSVSSLTSLSSLTLHDLKLTAMPGGLLKALTQLKRLGIFGCEQLETFLDMYDVPPSLTILSFISCHDLKSLPKGLHALTSLQRLEIRYCRQVQALPEEGLPTELQTLSISGCPTLEERCCKDTGEDWPKISHIRYLHVD